MGGYKRDYIGSADAMYIHNENFAPLIKSKLREKEGEEGFISAAMQRGLNLEVDVIIQFLEDNGLSFEDAVLQKSERGEDELSEYCFATLDGRTEDTIMEVKTSEKDAPEDEADLLRLRPDIFYQAQWQLWRSGLKKLVILWCKCPPIGGDETSFDSEGRLNVSVIPIKPKKRIFNKFVKNAPKFWAEWEEAKKNAESVDLATIVDVEKLIALEKAVEQAALSVATQRTEIAKLREEMLKAMEENGILSYKTDRITVSYTAAHENLVYDQAKLEKAGITKEKYGKKTRTKASIRVKIKDQEQEVWHGEKI